MSSKEDVYLKGSHKDGDQGQDGDGDLHDGSSAEGIGGGGSEKSGGVADTAFLGSGSSTGGGVGNGDDGAGEGGSGQQSPAVDVREAHGSRGKAGGLATSLADHRANRLVGSGAKKSGGNSCKRRGQSSRVNVVALTAGEAQSSGGRSNTSASREAVNSTVHGGRGGSVGGSASDFVSVSAVDGSAREGTGNGDNSHGCTSASGIGVRCEGGVGLGRGQGNDKSKKQHFLREEYSEHEHKRHQREKKKKREGEKKKSKLICRALALEADRPCDGECAASRAMKIAQQVEKVRKKKRVASQVLHTTINHCHIVL